MFTVHAGCRGFDSHRWHMSEWFFRSSRPGYPHPVCSELENSGIRVAVGDCRVAERRRWRPPYQTSKTVHVHANTLQTWQGQTHGAGCAPPWFGTAEPLGERHYENGITHIFELRTDFGAGCLQLWTGSAEPPWEIIMRIETTTAFWIVYYEPVFIVRCVFVTFFCKI